MPRAKSKSAATEAESTATEEPNEQGAAAPDVPVHPATWRATLQIHPAAELFPLMSPAELKELGEDIKANGLAHSIALWRANPDAPLELLDGRNRLDAIERITGAPVRVRPQFVSPPVIEVKAADDWHTVEAQGGVGVEILDSSVDPYAYVISTNIKRRHLNVEQRQQLLIALIARAPEKSNRQIGKEIGVTDKTVAHARAKGEDVRIIPNVSTRTDTRGRKQPARKGGSGKPEKKGEKGTREAGRVSRLRRTHSSGRQRATTSTRTLRKKYSASAPTPPSEFRS